MWSDLPNKEDDVYIPLLNAFKDELERQNHLFGKYTKTYGGVLTWRI